MLVSGLAVFALLFAAVLAVAWLGGRIVKGLRSHTGTDAPTAALDRLRARATASPLPTISVGRLPAPKAAPSKRKLQPFSGKAHVVDGDTLRMKQIRIRLFGMDAPEMSQSGGDKARYRLIGIIGGKEVRVEPLYFDCYGRIVARVWLGEIDVCERMVRDGYAVSYSKLHNDYDSAELYARRHRRGLWSDDAGGIGDPAAHRRQMAALKDAPEAPHPAGSRSASVLPFAPRSGPWSGRSGA